MTCKLVIRKKLVNNYNFNKKIVFVILVLSSTTVKKNTLKFEVNPIILKIEVKNALTNYIVHNLLILNCVYFKHHEGFPIKDEMTETTVWNIYSICLLIFILLMQM